MEVRNSFEYFKNENLIQIYLFSEGYKGLHLCSSQNVTN